MMVLQSTVLAERLPSLPLVFPITFPFKIAIVTPKFLVNEYGGNNILMETRFHCRNWKVISMTFVNGD